MKVEEFINLKQVNMIVEEFSLKFTMLSRCAPSLVSNPRDEMSRFLTSVSSLVKEECLTAMLHGDTNLSRLMVYAQSIEDSKLSSISRNWTRSGPSDQNQPMFKKKSPIQDEPREPKVKLQKGSGSHVVSLLVILVGKKTTGNV